MPLVIPSEVEESLIFRKSMTKEEILDEIKRIAAANDGIPVLNGSGVKPAFLNRLGQENIGRAGAMLFAKLDFRQTFASAA